MQLAIVTADRIVTGGCVVRRMIVRRWSGGVIERGDPLLGRRVMRSIRAAADHGRTRNSLEGKREEHDPDEQAAEH